MPTKLSHSVPVLGPSGIKLIFFTAAHIASSCRCVTRTLLGFSYCWTRLVEHQGLFFFPLRSSQSRSWKGTWLGQLTWNDRKDIPYHMTCCSAITAGGKEEEGGTSVVKAWPCYVCLLPEGGWASACWWELVDKFLIEFLLNSWGAEQATVWAVTCCPGSTRHSSLVTTWKKWALSNLPGANTTS